MSSDQTLANLSWPDYALGPALDIHALGAIAANYNYLESWLRFMFRVCLDLPPEVSLHLFAKFSTEARLNLIKQCNKASDYSDEIKEAVLYFCTAYSVCAENRNTLMHAQAAPVQNTDTDQFVVLFIKNPKNNPMSANFYDPGLNELRRIADEINAFAVYGRELGIFIAAKHKPEVIPSHMTDDSPTTLPDKPALPILLNPLPRANLRRPQAPHGSSEK